MVKCYKDKCCLDKYHRNSCNLFCTFQETYLYSLVKIGPLTAEILLTLSSWWVVVVVVVVMVVGNVQSHFRVKPKLR